MYKDKARLRCDQEECSTATRKNGVQIRHLVAAGNRQLSHDTSSTRDPCAFRLKRGRRVSDLRFPGCSDQAIKQDLEASRALLCHYTTTQYTTSNSTIMVLLSLFVSSSETFSERRLESSLTIDQLKVSLIVLQAPLSHLDGPADRILAVSRCGADFAGKAVSLDRYRTPTPNPTAVRYPGFAAAGCRVERWSADIGGMWSCRVERYKGA